LLDSLKAPVPLRIGEAFAVVIYGTAPRHLIKNSSEKRLNRHSIIRGERLLRYCS
jgi:hypothetical protein